MIKRFDVILEKNDNSDERKNLYAADVLEIFNNIPWQKEYDECLRNYDDFGSYFSVSYKDKFSDFEYSLDVELFFDEDSYNGIPVPISYTVSYSYQEERTKKIFFGLFGTKQVIKEVFDFLDAVSYESVVKYLEAFLRHDNEFLKNDMKEKNEADLKDNF